jgi:hypothetical protein
MTDEKNPQPPPFVVDCMYEDETSAYRVLSIDVTQMTFERTDGTRVTTTNIKLKADIHKRRMLERNNPRPISSQGMRMSSSSVIPEYKYEDVTPIIAAVIEKHSRRSRDWLSHSRLIKGFLEDHTARAIAEGLRRSQARQTPEAWVGVMIAGFSKEWSAGKHWQHFERKKMSRGHAWRVKPDR